ncbi:MAG: hypothetical protein Q9180_006232, partial [Flavoplaca navasiana]
SLYNRASDLWRSRDSPTNNDLPSTLREILGLLEEAKDSLKQAGISVPNIHVMICSRLMQAEREITYRCKTREERNHHIDLAVAYGKDALEAAKETGQPVVIAQVELEVTFTTGREILLGVGLRDRDDRVLKLARHEAIRRINDALIKMKFLNHGLYEEYKKDAEEYWIRHLGDSGATSAPE